MPWFFCDDQIEITRVSIIVQHASASRGVDGEETTSDFLAVPDADSSGSESGSGSGIIKIVDVQHR